MRLIGVTIAALLLAASGSAGGDTSSKRPTLRLVDFEPLTVRGHNFKSGERVKLLVSARSVQRLAAKASARGEFTVELSARADRCTAVVVQAFGNRGSRAMVDMTTPDCASVDRIDP